MEELCFRAMGSEAHVIVVGGGPGLAVRARERIAELERRWSRFLPDSETSELTRRAGSPVVVSDETVQLITCAVEAWRFTGATFDPTVLGAVLRAGYSESFELLAPGSAGGSTSDLVIGCTDIEMQLLVPLTSSWHPVAVAGGIVAFYLLVAVEVTSLLRPRIPKRVWRATHYLSFPLFALVTVHALSAGTDRNTILMRWGIIVIAAGVTVLAGIRSARPSATI